MRRLLFATDLPLRLDPEQAPLWLRPSRRGELSLRTLGAREQAFSCKPHACFRSRFRRSSVKCVAGSRTGSRIAERSRRPGRIPTVQAAFRLSIAAVAPSKHLNRDYSMSETHVTYYTVSDHRFFLGTVALLNSLR